MKSYTQLDAAIARQQQLAGELAQARGRERAVRELHRDHDGCRTIRALDELRPDIDVDQVADRILTALRSSR